MCGGGVNRLLSGVYGLASNNTLHRPPFVEKIGAIWFLRALFIGNVLMSIVLTYVKKSWLQLAVIIVLLLAAVCQTSVYCSPIRLNYGCGFLIWLYLGYVCAKYQEKLKCYVESNKGVLVCLILWAIVVLLEGVYGIYSIPSVRFRLFGLEIVGGICGIMSVMTFSKCIVCQSDILRGIFSYLGRTSLWILCVHAVSLEMIKYMHVNNDSIFISLIRVVFDICIALLLKEFVSKIIIQKKAV